VWLCGGIIYSYIGGQAIYYFLGIAATFMYLPLYWYRKWEDARNGYAAADMATSGN
jgi:uncharacterized membrane protein YjfL (UPF0719 family)